MVPPPFQADELLRAALRGERPAWPPDAPESLRVTLLDRARLHGVSGLVHETVLAWPESVLAGLREAAVAQAMWELRHQQILADVLASLSPDRVQPILIKGTALAYSLYSEPALRARGDSDLFIAPEDRDRVHARLLAMGFQRQASSAGEATSYQANYIRDGHVLDLHWRINNSQVLAGLFGHAEVLAHAKPLPALSPHASAPSEVHSLLLACMHRATHVHNPYYVAGIAHHDPDRLIWLQDIHLLAERLDEMQWHECIELARDKGLAGACLQGLEHARAALGTSLPDFVQQGLAAAGSELASSYLEADALRQQWMDFRALRSWSERKAWLRERLFPPPAHMHGKYPRTRAKWLPWLYLRRAAAGLWRAAGLTRR